MYNIYIYIYIHIYIWQRIFIQVWTKVWNILCFHTFFHTFFHTSFFIPFCIPSRICLLTIPFSIPFFIPASVWFRGGNCAEYATTMVWTSLQQWCGATLQEWCGLRFSNGQLLLVPPPSSLLPLPSSLLPQSSIVYEPGQTCHLFVLSSLKHLLNQVWFLTTHYDPRKMLWIGLDWF